jgi:hypothetical protein
MFAFFSIRRKQHSAHHDDVPFGSSFLFLDPLTILTQVVLRGFLVFMTLVAVSRVRNECDIIEAFVRHHCQLFDQLVVVDDGSTDGTYEILQSLQAERLPVQLNRDPAVADPQARYLTRLVLLAVHQLGADWVMPLDADEFVEPGRGKTLAQVLDRRPPHLLKVAWHGFLWRRENERSMELNPVVRMRWRMPRSPDFLSKVLVPASLVTDAVHLAQGNHDLLLDDIALPAQALDDICLCRFPIRSIEQYAGKIAVGYLQHAATAGWGPRTEFHYLAPVRALTEGLDRFAETMSADSRRYSFSPQWSDPGDPTDAPLDYRGGPLKRTAPPGSPLVNALHCAETIASKFAESSGQIELAQHALLEANGIASKEAARIIAQETEARMVVRERPRAIAGTHIFRSFWGGGALTPYAAFCLKSFIDCGHAFDLYTFETALAVPAGVRLCDAREYFNADDFFVYADGFGQGSPSAFANVFRCKLLAEKGGWWVDTDVFCRARDIPAFREFFAWEDPGLINNAVMCLEPGHPMIVACLAEALQKGRSVRWGEIGPVLTTRKARELGFAHRAYPSSVCYPVHYSEAIDLLRPARADSLRRRTSGSLFVHLWNAMLNHHGVDKMRLPPQGSLLRAWIDRHPVDGWTGQYDTETLEAGLQLHTEPRMRPSAELAAGIEDLARERDVQAAMSKRRLIESDHRHIESEKWRIESEKWRVASEQWRVQSEQWRVASEQWRVQAELLRTSTSWKLTAPLRSLSRGWHRLRHRKRDDKR